MGANPRIESDSKTSNVPREDDLQSYRALLAQSDDFEDGGSQVLATVSFVGN
jgi:hypothetical protein